MIRHGDITDRALLSLAGAGAGALLGWLALLPDLPDAWRAPGTPLLQGTAIAGALLLLAPLAFAVAKRSGRTRAAVPWFSVHAIAALVGSVLVTVHTAGRLDQPPALLLLALAALMALGVWARVRGARLMADTFGTKHKGLAATGTQARERLAAIIDEKTRVLAALDPHAREATFSVTLAHWLSRPGLARRYAALEREEATTIGQRASVPAAQAWWRALHLLLAGVFLLGLAVHVVLVTLFAGWVADGGEVYWWHLAAWGGMTT